MPAKPWWASRTMAVFIVTGIGAVLECYGYTDIITPGTEPELVALVMSMTGVVLRAITSRPLRT